MFSVSTFSIQYFFKIKINCFLIKLFHSIKKLLNFKIEFLIIKNIFKILKAIKKIKE